MFEVNYTKHKNCYLVVTKSTGDKFYVRVSPCLGYPKTAKRPYKGQVYLIKNNKFIKLNMAESSSRQLYSTIMDRVTQFIQRQQDIITSIKEEEEFQGSLIEQTLDDITY